MSPDDTLNRLLHTWPCFKLVNAHLLASSRAQVREGHVVSNKTFKTHLPVITRFKSTRAMPIMVSTADNARTKRVHYHAISTVIGPALVL